MAHEGHKEAAKHHTEAATRHTAAAEKHESGNHEEAHEHSEHAHAASSAIASPSVRLAVRQFDIAHLGCRLARLHKGIPSVCRTPGAST
jgi:pyruvate/2-oxoglutarate dehydrogenase complex dihydrolipoamide acyltransferase (E2) component